MGSKNKSPSTDERDAKALNWIERMWDRTLLQGDDMRSTTEISEEGRIAKQANKRTRRKLR